MMSHRRYALILAGTAVAAVLALGLWGRGFQPLRGDLTRIGWRSENDFGWTLPKERFDPPAAEAGKPDGHYDIIAIGDSFTAETVGRGATTWPQYLAHATGLKIGIFDNGYVSLDQLLDSKGFREAPPQVLIYEIVERNLIPSQRGGAEDGCPTDVTTTPAPTLTRQPPGIDPQPETRPTERPWYDLPATYAAAYLVHNLERRLAGHELTTSVQLDLSRGGLFSSRRDRQLLVYGEDFNKMAWTEADWREAACSLLRLQARVQSNGRTLFLAMVVPDKLTAYGPFLANPEFQNISRLPVLAEYPALHLVPLGAALDPTRSVDLYLPNDTHWSTVGHALAAQQVENALIKQGVLSVP